MSKPYIPQAEEYERPTPRRGYQKGVLMQKTRTIKAGDYLECEIFPVVEMEPGIRERKRRKSPEAIRRINEKNAVKSLERLANANFSEKDLMPHLTMDKPCDLETMLRTVQNFIRRLKRRAKKRGAACKYIYVIETTGEGARQRHHVHMLLNGGWISRDEVEALWMHGLARVDRVQRQEKGLCGFVRYITMRKETQARLLSRRWGSSKGLKQPEITVSKHKFSRRAADAIARAAEGDAKTIFEKRYPGYQLIEQPLIRYSEFLPGVYIYAMMRRSDKT